MDPGNAPMFPEESGDDLNDETFGGTLDDADDVDVVTDTIMGASRTCVSVFLFFFSSPSSFFF